MPDRDDDRPVSPASRRTAGTGEQDDIRVPEEPPQVPDYRLEAQPVESGRQPARPGQPGRWEDHPGQRDARGIERAPEKRPQGQHEKA